MAAFTIEHKMTSLTPCITLTLNRNVAVELSVFSTSLLLPTLLITKITLPGNHSFEDSAYLTYNEIYCSIFIFIWRRQKLYDFAGGL